LLHRFTPKHPNTRPSLDKIKKSESMLDTDSLVKAAVQGVERIVLKRRTHGYSKIAYREKLKIATAESCTGGLIAKLITDRAARQCALNAGLLHIQTR
jgi:hypothetical protein